MVYHLSQGRHFAIDHMRQMVTKPINKVIVILSQRKEQHVSPIPPSHPCPPPLVLVFSLSRKEQHVPPFLPHTLHTYTPVAFLCSVHLKVPLKIKGQFLLEPTLLLNQHFFQRLVY